MGARSLRVEFGAGEIVIEPSTDDTLTVQLSASLEGDGTAYALVHDSHVGVRGDEVYVRVPRPASWMNHTPQLHLEIRLPDRVDLSVRSDVADLRSSATPRQVRAETGSGDLSISRATGPTEIRSGSGSVLLGRFDGDLRVKSGSGDVEIQYVGGDSSITTGSGDIRIGEAGGAAQLKSGSGDIVVRESSDFVSAATGSGGVRIERTTGSSLVAESASGDISVGVPEGTRAWLDVSTVSGDIGSELQYADPPANDTPTLELRARTTSGDIELLHS